MGSVENETGEIPFFHFRTARPYGRPEHKKAYGPQDALTKLVTTMMSTSAFAAFPQTWALPETGTSPHERRVGKESVSNCTTQFSPFLQKQTIYQSKA